MPPPEEEGVGKYAVILGLAPSMRELPLGATAARHREIHVIILVSLVISGFRDGREGLLRRIGVFSTQYKISPQGVLDLAD